MPGKTNKQIGDKRKALAIAKSKATLTANAISDATPVQSTTTDSSNFRSS
jgi:hypothetical protein